MKCPQSESWNTNQVINLSISCNRLKIINMKKIVILFLVIGSLSACEKPFQYNLTDIPTDFVPLAKPKDGYQIHVKPFPIPSNFEREWYLRMPIGNNDKIYVTSFEAKMRDGTHHFIAYPFKNEKDPTNPKIGVMRDQNLPNGQISFRSNLNMNGFILESTAPEYRVDLPGGYALPFEAGATLDFNSHYYNKTGKTLFGEIYFNVYTKPKDQIKGELQEIIQENGDFVLPANKTTVIENTVKFEELTRLVMLTSHTHKHGKKFEIYGVGGVNDGKLIYSSTDYVHPVINYYEKPLTFQKGEAMRSVVTYVNNTNRTLKFGVTSEDEMLITYGYFIKN
jgi:Copper type II ascorbate-dependent monooxygenase, C-terminal domain